MQDRGSQVVSQLAVWDGAAEGGSFVSGSLERQNRVPPAVRDSPPVPSSEASLTRDANRVLFIVVAVLSLAGMIVSAVSLERHYAKSATAYCDFSQKFSCDIVNRSEYSSLMGIPVAAIGVAGLAVAFYLTYIEAYVLTTWCILCLASLVLISLINLLAITVKLRAARA